MSEKSIHSEVSLPPKKIMEALQYCADIYDFMAYVVRKRGSLMDECDKLFLRELMEELHVIFELMNEVEYEQQSNKKYPIKLITCEKEFIHPNELIIIDYIENKKHGSNLSIPKYY